MLEFARWPYNLLEEVFGDEDEPIILPPDFLGTVDYCIDELGIRAATILRWRYQEERTLEEIGKAFGVTRERVRQVIAKSLRDLYREKRFILLGVKGVIQEQCKNAADAAIRSTAALHVAHVSKDAPEKDTVETAGMLLVPLSHLGLSVRSYNCLKRAGADTVGDVLNMSKYELLHVRNLGKRSAGEIIQALERMGLNCDHLR